MKLDIQTTYIFIFFSMLITTIGVLIATFEHRDRQASIWCLSWVSTSVTALLIGLRGFIPDVISFQLAHVFLFFGYVGHVMPLRFDLVQSKQEENRYWYRYGFIGLLYLFAFNFLIVNRYETARMYLVLIVVIVMTVDFCFVAYSLYKRFNYKSGAFLVFTSLIIVVAAILRMIEPFAKDISISRVFDFGLGNVVFVSSWYVFTILINFGFICLRFEKLRRAKIQVEKSLETSVENVESLNRVVKDSQHLAVTLEKNSRDLTIDIFTSALAHELNQPLTAINISAFTARLCLDRNNNPAMNYQKIKESLDNILKYQTKASEIISNLRSIYVTNDDCLIPIDFIATIQDVLIPFVNEAKNNNITVEEIYEKNSLFVFANPAQLQQIAVNLFNNAIQACESSNIKKIRVKIESSDGMISFRISDSGVGISEESMKMLFEPFFTTKFNGMGIGLVICQTIAQRHSGIINVQNLPEGGACFELKIPKIPC